MRHRVTSRAARLWMERLPRLTYNSARPVRQLRGPAAHANVLGTRRAFEYSECGAPHQFGGGRGGGRIFERDEADPQPRTGHTECQLDAVEQALPKPGASRPAGPWRHNSELCRADPPHRVRETAP